MPNLIQNSGIIKMEITTKPTEKLEIQDMFELPLDTLVTNQALSGGNLMWTDGILICFGGFPTTDKLIHEQVEGSYHWLHLEYTFEMKEYTPTLKGKLLNQQVPVYNMSYHPFYQDVAKFMAKDFSNFCCIFSTTFINIS